MIALACRRWIHQNPDKKIKIMLVIQVGVFNTGGWLNRGWKNKRSQGKPWGVTQRLVWLTATTSRNRNKSREVVWPQYRGFEEGPVGLGLPPRGRYHKSGPQPLKSTQLVLSVPIFCSREVWCCCCWQLLRKAWAGALGACCWWKNASGSHRWEENPLSPPHTLWSPANTFYWKNITRSELAREFWENAVCRIQPSKRLARVWEEICKRFTSQTHVVAGDRSQTRCLLLGE